jgi:ATP-binding cassette subfamily B protein
MAASERVFRLLDTPAADLSSSHAPARGHPAERPSSRAPASGHPAEQPSVTDTQPHADTQPTAVEGTRTPPAKRGVTVEFRDVWFAYDTGHVARDDGQPVSPEWVLKGVCFKVEPGRTLALVGHTGAGKTTIINLLLRFYDPQQGVILLDGVDIRTIPVKELRSRIGYVQQDIFLFAGDVLTNIRLSSPISEEAVATAASRVGADRVIRRLPRGYDQVLGERGGVDQRRRATAAVVRTGRRGGSGASRAGRGDECRGQRDRSRDPARARRADARAGPRSPSRID